jgi:hypothetical protein
MDELQTSTETPDAGKADAIAAVELKVDRAVERDARLEGIREALAIATSVVGVGAVGAAIASAGAEVLAATAGIAVASAGVGTAAAVARELVGALRVRQLRQHRWQAGEPDPLIGLVPSRMAARHRLTFAANDPTLVTRYRSNNE